MQHPRKSFFFLVRCAFRVRRHYALEMDAYQEGVRKRKPRWSAMCHRVLREKIPDREKRENFIYFPVFLKNISEINKKIREKNRGLKRKKRKALRSVQLKIF